MIEPHDHAWQHKGYGMHFPVEPNTKRRPRSVHLLQCPCGQRGFRYGSYRVVYTWCPADAQDATENKSL